jgi:hypothetical protein
MRNPDEIIKEVRELDDRYPIHFSENEPPEIEIQSKEEKDDYVLYFCSDIEEDFACGVDSDLANYWYVIITKK